MPYRHDAVLYALLCDAARGERGDGASAIPDGLLLDAPECARIDVATGESYAFGATLIDADPARASRRLRELAAGLIRLGRDRPARPVALGGNFDLVDVRDLVAGVSLAPGDAHMSLPATCLTEECIRLLTRLGQPITLRFLSPLRLERPGSEVEQGHRYADERHMNAGLLLRTVQRRLAAIGIIRDSETESAFGDEAIELIENRLNWVDLEYGRRDRRKSLGGALGRVRVRVTDPAAQAALVWGQCTRVGRNLHFGFGRYRIEEIGPDPAECTRAVPLLDLCLEPARMAASAAGHEVSVESLRAASDQMRAGSFEPDPAQKLVLREADGGRRELRIPTRRDRALQRLLLARLAPAFDRLFETSSFAWRRGLSREAAARRIERLAHDGWIHAVRADFDRFFDRIPQDLLRDRLEAWTGDDPLVAAVMAFVTSGRPGGVGIPTGAPLSPLLGNMLLDRFDEEIEREGGRLVRYADDFLLLTRTREEASRMEAHARELAQALKLQLNDDAAVCDLREPFEFLGYRFQLEASWEYDGPRGPRLVHELGWRDADRTPSPLSIRLPGETDAGPSQGVVVVGPGLERLDVVGDDLHVRFRDGREGPGIALAGIDRLVILGPAEWAPDLPGRFLRAGTPVLLVSEHGWPLGELAAEMPEDPEVLCAQARATADRQRALEIARGLVRAKLRNHAALMTVVAPEDGASSSRVRELADGVAAAETLQALRGMEGAGAAIWYRVLPRAIGRGFRFDVRVMPDAADPVNVLLNIGHTMLHRHAIAACRAAGLSPALGFLHAPTPRFAALAADLQEPFRHLVERAVILATRRLRPSQFIPRENGSYPLALEHNASRTFHALLQRSWAACVTGRGQSEPRPWHNQMVATARSLRRHLVDPQSPWEAFEHE